MHRSLTVLTLGFCLAAPALAQEITRDQLAEGMATLDGTWRGLETKRKGLTNAATAGEPDVGFESAMNALTYTATVTNDGVDPFTVRVEEGALVYSSPGRIGEQRREITEFYPVDEDGNWYILTTYTTPFTDGAEYDVKETYRMDMGVYTRMMEAQRTDKSEPPMMIRWGTFTKTEE